MISFELTEEQIALKKTVRDFAQHEISPLVRELDELPAGEVKGRLQWQILEKACELGLMSGFLPRQYGGTLGGLAACVAGEEIAAVDAGVCALITGSGLGISPVALAQDKVLMDRYFPQIVEAEKAGKPILWSYGITEPEAGSDVEDQIGSRTARLSTAARREGNHYIINGSKQFCSLANMAKLISVFATTEKSRGISAWTCIIVHTESPGFTVERIEATAGGRACPTCAISFDNVRVPVENQVGEEGQGWALNRQCLAYSRPAAGASGVGIARGAYELALGYAKERFQGGKQIIEHQMIQQMLADMAIQIEAARLLCYRAASCRPISMKFSSMAKVFGTDLAVKVSIDAIQILGGYGLVRDYGVEKYLRDAKTLQIVEGTNQINRIAVMEGVINET